MGSGEQGLFQCSPEASGGDSLTVALRVDQHKGVDEVEGVRHDVRDEGDR